MTFKFDLLGKEKFCISVIQVVEDRKPFSFVRLGDGEGAMLNFGTQSEFDDVLYLSQHFGARCTIDEALEIRHNLVDAINNSDVVGIRDYLNDVQFTHRSKEPEREYLSRFRQAFLHEDASRLNYVDAKRVGMLHKNLAEFSFPEGVQFADHQIGWDFYASGALPYILSRQKKVGVVSSRPDLGERLRHAYNIDVQQYLIPDKFESQQKGCEAHYPDAYRKLISAIDVEFEGMIFLVGGGIIGKGYCTKIKNNGGIAFDLGGVVDAWVGKLSRPRPLRARYRLKKKKRIEFRRKYFPVVKSYFAVPEELIMNEANAKALVERWKQKNT